MDGYLRTSQDCDLTTVISRQRFDNILGRNRAFAQNLPGTVFSEKHDRRCNCPRRRPPCLLYTSLRGHPFVVIGEGPEARSVFLPSVGHDVDQLAAIAQMAEFFEREK